MSASDPSDSDVVDPLTDDPLAFLYDPGEEEEDEDSTADNPGYGSLMGLAVRREGIAVRPAKAMAIVLDETEAQRAAEVMEINAGQLMTNPDRSSRHVSFLGLDPVDAMQIEEEDDLAESLSWEDEEDEDPDWQPENPLAGTGVAEEDDDAEWQPENPLAGTGLEETNEDDGVDWQPVNPLAGTGIEQQDDWDEPVAEAVQAPTPAASLSETAEEPAPAASLFETAEEDDWTVPETQAVLPEAPPPETVPPEADLWESVLPRADTPAPIEEQAWSGRTAEEPVQEFAEVEWEAPLVPAAEAEDEPVEAEAAFDAPAEPAPPEEPELAEQTALEGDEPPPIEWQLLLAKKTPKKPLDLSPIDWGEFAAEEEELEASAEEPVSEDAFAELAAPAEHDMPEPASEDEPEPAAAEWAAEPVEPAEPEWPVELVREEPIEEAIEKPAEPAAPYWEQFAEEEAAEEPVAAAEPEWQGYAEEEVYEEAALLEEPIPEPEPEPEPIEILHIPVPPPVEIPHHSLRAKLIKVQQPRTPPPSRIKPVLKWLHAQFVGVVLPRLKQLYAWIKAKWDEIAARPPRD